MIDITVSEELKLLCPDFIGAAIVADVQNSELNEKLWDELNKYSDALKDNLAISDIRHHPNIDATRTAYKAFGKDPNRYRPAAEALMRRVVRNLPLYQIDTLVDLVNLVSIKTGYSMGGFDYNHIEGSELELGIGETDEKFVAIGRGLLNIEGLPVYRDEVGGIGTPTSDEERTKIRIETSRLLILINAYRGDKDDLTMAVNYTITLLSKFAEGQNIESIYY